MHKLIKVVCLFLTVPVIFVGAQLPLHDALSNELSLTPTEVVKKYCQLDFDGVRLSSEGSDQVLPLIVWENEPGWDTVTIVSGFHLGSPMEKNNRATVVVTYSVLGTFSGDTFTPAREAEKVEKEVFELRRIENSWKIEQPVIQPHVSIRSISKHIRKLIGREHGNTPRKHDLNEVLKQLKALEK